MKEILVIAYYFPPVATSGAMRPLAFCQYLGEYGWAVRVVSADPASIFPPLEVDVSLAQRIPPEVQVTRVPHRSVLHTIRGTGRQVSEAIGGIGKKSRCTSGLVNQIGSMANGQIRPLLKAVANHLIDFPDPQRSWLRPAVRTACELARAQRPRVILATGGPWTSLLVGANVARELDVPLVTDFRDPWVRNPFPVQGGDALFHWRARLAEQRICSVSTTVIANTPALHDRFIADYPDLQDRFVTITNGFDRRLSTAIAGNTRLIPADIHMRPGHPLELVHFGSVYGKRDPSNLLQAVNELQREQAASAGQVRLRFVGQWHIYDSRCCQLADELEANGMLVREAPVPHDTCLERMQDAPVLLVLQGSSPLQIPAKIYEYIASGQPILFVGGEGATAQLVAEYGLGLQCRDEVAAIKALLGSVLSGAREFSKPSPESTARFDYRSLTASLAEVLDVASA